MCRKRPTGRTGGRGTTVGAVPVRLGTREGSGSRLWAEGGGDSVGVQDGQLGQGVGELILVTIYKAVTLLIKLVE